MNFFTVILQYHHKKLVQAPSRYVHYSNEIIVKQ